MKLVNISSVKKQLPLLIEKVRGGEEVIIAKAGKPVAKLVPYRQDRTFRSPGALRGRIKIADDFEDLPPDMAYRFGVEK